MAKLPIIAFVGFALASMLNGSQPSQEPKMTQVDGIPALPAPKTYSVGDNETMTVTYRIVQQADLPVYFEACERQCKGEKHILHEQCDDTCDTPCRRRHSTVIHAELMKYGYSNNQETTGRNGFRRNLQKFGVSRYNADDLMAFMSEEVMHEADLKKFDRKVGAEHWAKPCTQVFRDYNGAAYYIYVDIALFRSAPLPNDPNHQIKGPVSTVTLAHLGIPIEGYKDNEFINCRCSIIKEGKDPDAPQTTGTSTGGTTGGKTGTTGTPTTTGSTGGRTGGATGTTGTTGEVGQIPRDVGRFVFVYAPMEQFTPTPAYEEKIKLQCEVENMNECTWSAENFGPDPIDVWIYPGGELICTDPAYQTMCSASMVRLHLPGIMERGPSAPERVSAKGRLFCINMEKEQPTGKQTYRIGTSSGSALSRLGQYYDKEAFQGPEGQIRAWIVSDHASLADIQQHMIFPKATPAQYLRSLYVVATVGGVDLTSPEFAKCLDPTLIMAAPNSAATLDWYASIMARRDAARLHQALGELSQMQALWNSSSRTAGAFTADLANALRKTGDGTLALDAARILLAVPAEFRASVVAGGGLNAVGSLLTGSDAELATAALDVLEQYQDKRGRFFAQNVSKTLPAELQTRSKTLADKLK